MNRTKWIQIALTASLLIMVSAVATQATVLRAFVSSTGNDANAASNCPQTTPCKTFAGAFPVVTAGGELIALDTSGYGPLTITKAITIATVPGATAFVVAATGTSGFTVSAGVTDQVIVRNINFNGSGAASTTGLLHNTGKLFVRDCTFTQLTIGVATNAKMELINCDLTNNGTAVQATGDGADVGGACPACFVAGQTSIKIVGGNITNNTLALSMVNPGVGTGGNKINIWVFQVTGSGIAFLTNFADNVTLVSGSGTGCGMGLCTGVKHYSDADNPR